MHGTERGQALVEFALVAPVLMLMVLGVLAGGIYAVAAMVQQSGTATLAAWVAANPDDPTGDVEAAIGLCPGGATIATDAAGLVVVTVVCPSFAGQLLPVFPLDVTTRATAYTAGASPTPTAEPSPTPSDEPSPSPEVSPSTEP